MGSASVGVQCPLTFSLGEFLGYWAGSGILCWCPSPFPLPSISGCYVHSSSPAIEFHSYFFFTADVSAPIRSIFHLLIYFVDEFPGLGLAMEPIVVVPEAEQVS